MGGWVTLTAATTTMLVSKTSWSLGTQINSNEQEVGLCSSSVRWGETVAKRHEDGGKTACPAEFQPIQLSSLVGWFTSLPGLQLTQVILSIASCQSNSHEKGGFITTAGHLAQTISVSSSSFQWLSQKCRTPFPHIMPISWDIPKTSARPSPAPSGAVQ